MDSFWAVAIIPNADIQGVSGKGCGVEGKQCVGWHGSKLLFGKNVGKSMVVGV